MDWLTQLFFFNDKFLGVEWHFWKVVGWLGNCIFFSRFMVQWYASERTKRVVVPVAFWWLSLSGTLILLSYALYLRNSVFIFAYAFSWIPYIRNLMIHRRHQKAHVDCPECATSSPPSANYCAECGAPLLPETHPKQSSDATSL